ncbi:MAG: polysaccharide biosynthesis C-terminal domain-containing protein [Roseiflexaceae bacterium]|nr:polysaccharide biosynthesis C-terminal domain-containing protein [Roseiflexaceae bacterium]
MRGRLTQLARLTAGYSLASFVGPIFTILLTPLYTRVLQPADYAVLDTLTTIGLFVTALASLGLAPAATVLFYDGDDAYKRSVIATAALIGFAWSVVLGTVLWFAAPAIAAATLGGSSQAALIMVSAINLPMATLAGIIQAALRLRMAVKRANTLALSNLLLTVLLNIVFVLLLNMGVWGIQIAISLTTLWMVIAGVLMLRTEGWGRPTRLLVAPLIQAGLPLLPGALSLWALAYLDRLLLPAFEVSLDERGLYAIGAKLASMLAILTVPFQSAWGPLALAMRADQQAERTYAKVLTLFTAGALGLALGLALFARELLLIFTTPVYAAAAPYVGLLVYVAVANGATVTVSVGAALEKRTHIIGIATMVGAALNLSLNIILIPHYGAWGAAWATAIGYAATPILVYVWSQRVHPLPYQPGRTLVALGTQITLLLIGMALPELGWTSFGLRMLLLAAYPIALLALRVIEPREVRALLGRVG